MSILDKLNPIKALLGVVRGTIDDIHTSGEERDEAHRKLREIEIELDLEVLKVEKAVIESQASVVMAEINGKSWMQRNWRPSLMFVFIAIIFNNFILLPYFPNIQVLEFPTAFWSLLTVSVGGYIGARTYEKKLKLENGRDDA